MGRNLSNLDDDDQYVHGDHWLIDDRTGFRIRKSEAVQEWNGAIVAREDAEPRHPQEYVRGRADRQAVRPARPEPPVVFGGSLNTVLTADATAGAYSLDVESSAGFDVGDRVIVYLENGDAHITTIGDGAEPLLTEDGNPFLTEDGEILYAEAPAASPVLIYLVTPLPWPAASGAEIASYTDTPIPDIG